MTSLYNCKHSGDQYKITKFDSDFNVEASYLCDLHSCECPAGHRPTCRHRQMLPKFIARDAVGSNWFFDFDRGGWVQGWKEEPAKEIIFTCLKCEDNYSVDTLTTECPVCGWKEPSLTITHEITLPADATGDDIVEAFGNLLASAALPIQPEPEPSPSSPSPFPTIRRRV